MFAVLMQSITMRQIPQFPDNPVMNPDNVSRVVCVLAMPRVSRKVSRQFHAWYCEN